MQDSNNQPEDETSEEDILEMAREEKVSYRKGERSLEQFHRWHQSGRLILDPDWQRNYVWTPKRASLLIESLLIDIPIPLIYLAQNDRDEYEVIDGQQRLNSIFDFFNNK